jgi:hypothetical protein
VLRADVPIPVVTKVVKTTNGDVQGLVKDGVQVFEGNSLRRAAGWPVALHAPGEAQAMERCGRRH